ncbi:protein 4.2-like [Elgaria multicarinata webbii]|uniref:protein 4.2-like n=1 Tax=Elgaria multicarinata webbii TaxID=159646 RepID=UPI002FCD02A8
MGQALQVKSCDFQAARNNRAHRTVAISMERLVVRRGQDFTLVLRFSSPVPGGLRQVRKTTLVAQTGQRPSKADGSLVRFPISRLGSLSGWQATVQAQDALSWTLVVTPPANAAIGHYTLLLQDSGQGQGAQHPLGTFTLLFNPWCRDDGVFLANEAQRQEYVLNQEGTIYWGLQDAPQQQPWDFGQLEEDLVHISLALLEMSLLWLQDATCAQRSSPLHVCRLANAMINSKTHRAILEGRWTGQYSDGTPPFKWPGSAPILRQWLAAQGQPVRYGQCWVFAAVLCSVLRSLGIPTRVVSGFAWAQDTAGNLQVDEYFDESGALIPGHTEATIWPFHAWNECWMARGDLPPGYGGWQALDPTPQVGGSGPRCCGPAPVRAIKEGRVDLLYDVATFFAATNARATAWTRRENGDLERAFCAFKYVGNNLSTKGVGTERCEDVTRDYKHPEGSAKEAAVLRKACPELEQLSGRSACDGGGGNSTPPLAQEEKEPLFFARLQARSPLPLGQDAQVAVAVANRAGQEKCLQLVLGAQPLQYDGKPLAQFWKEEFQFSLPGGHEQVLSTTLPYAEYGPALTSGLLLQLTALLREAAVPGPARLACQEIHLSAPELTLQVPGRVVQFHQAEAEMRLSNPLPEALVGCIVSVSGRGLVYKERRYRPGPIPAGGTLHLRIPFTPTQEGSRRLTVRLESRLLQPLTAHTTMEVTTA